MKIIDTHVHAFADVIAERAVKNVSERMKKRGMGGVALDGRVTSLERSMDENGIDMAVILPIATKPTQTDILNDWAAELGESGERFVCFGAIHPENENYRDILGRIKARGFKGVKMHPVFQAFRVDDEKALGIFRECGRLGLRVTLHAGSDLYDDPRADASPQAIAEALRESPETVFVAAHMGGRQQWEEAARYLFGKNIWLDTALAATFISPPEFVKMVRAHGADKIMFGTDSPWRDQGEAAEYIKRCGLTAEEKEKIFYKNAEIFLNL